jgi:hypothetical protein
VARPPQAGRYRLSPIPFVRVRERLPSSMLKQSMDYDGYVKQVNAAMAGAGVVLELLNDTSTLRIADGAVLIKLEPGDFIVYRVLAEWAKAAVPGAGPDGVGGDHKGWITLDMLKRPQNYQRSPIERVIALGGNTKTYVRKPNPDDGTPNSAFGQAVSRLRKKIAGSVAEQRGWPTAS